jgi:hypothetical protein
MPILEFGNSFRFVPVANILKEYVQYVIDGNGIKMLQKDEEKEGNARLGLRYPLLLAITRPCNSKTTSVSVNHWVTWIDEILPA